MKKHDVALLGLGVMGSSLARNLASRNLRTLVWNRHVRSAEKLFDSYGSYYLDYRKDLKSLVKDLKMPRKLILMVPAGKPVDELIKKLTPLLSKGDVLIDGGNSNYHDTIARTQALKKKGIKFVGLGVSGGEEGALNGPSLMPGGDSASWKLISPMLKKIAAKDFKGSPCVTHIGTDGAGHYVKMVHNGIEYAVMQLMAEAYAMLSDIYGLKADKIAKIFAKYNKGKLKSYLFEISVPVLMEDGNCAKGNLVDCILDKAGQKGTGRWVALDALERGAALPTITSAVYARSLSAFKKERVKLSKLYKKRTIKPKVPLTEFVKTLEDGLYAGMISCYAQGFELMRLAAEEQKWKLNFAEIARMWEGGCIIRAKLLNDLHKAFAGKKGKPVHLFEIPAIQRVLKRDVPALRAVTCFGALHGSPDPGFATALSYFESMTSERLSANFIQGLRDYFGAHTYERTDKKGTFHTEWN